MNNLGLFPTGPNSKKKAAAAEYIFGNDFFVSQDLSLEQFKYMENTFSLTWMVGAFSGLAW